MIECAFTARIGRDPEFRRVKGGELALLSFSAVVDPDPKAQEALNAASGPVSGNRKPQPHSWMSYSIGRSGFYLGAVMIRPKRQVRSELYISGERAKAFFHLLHEQKGAIEQELGYPLEWEELPNRQDCRISTYLNEVDPEDEEDWRRQHEWLASRLNDMHRVFANRVRTLDAHSWRGDDGPEAVVPGSSSLDVAS